MCGIYGGFAFNNRGMIIIKSFKSRLEETARLRGRDGHGRFEFKNGYIGVSRAQPLPEGEEIPLPLKHDGLVMVFNGTISNDKELAERHGFDRESVDTWTAIRLWSKKGLDACEEFVGGYAFGVYDEVTETLTVAKNFKTLWYVLTDDCFLFASEKEFLETDDSKFGRYVPSRFPQNTGLVVNETSHRERSLSRKYWSHTPDLDNNKAVIVTSGGIDSITSAYIAKFVHKKEIALINFDYGQLASEREWEAVKYAGESIGCPCLQVDLSLLGAWGASPLTDPTIELPLGMKSAESTLCWTPARNMLMIAYASAYAEAHGIKYIYFGNNMEEEATGYSDNDLEFIYLYNQLLDYGTLKGIKIKRALGRLMKPEILQVGAYLGVDYDRTWSCDLGGEKPCGVCGCCTTRQYAFKRANLPDGQTYENPLQDIYPWEGHKEYDVEELLDRLHD